MPILTYTQHLPAPIEEVFRFHQDPYNLLKITPPDLNLTVTNKETIEMRKGAEITYQIKWLGLPLNWRTLITAYDPPNSFTDVQVKGPYRKWEHTHTFTSQGNDGTLVTDRIDYELPLGALGALVAGRIIRRQLEGIFAYRSQMFEKHFPRPH